MVVTDCARGVLGPKLATVPDGAMLRRTPPVDPERAIDVIDKGACTACVVCVVKKPGAPLAAAEEAAPGEATGLVAVEYLLILQSAPPAIEGLPPRCGCRGLKAEIRPSMCPTSMSLFGRFIVEARLCGLCIDGS